MGYKPAPFLEKYDTILFDRDGVITREEVYWKAAALTVYEFLNSKNYYGSKEIVPRNCEQMAEQLMKEYFCDSKTIRLVKNRGVNTNWDLAYLVLAASFHLEEGGFRAVYDYLKSIDSDAYGMYAHAEEILADDLCVPKDHVKRFGAFWTEIQHCFQEWILGDKIFPREWHVSSVQLGKGGIMFSEKPIVDFDKLIEMIEALSKTHTLGIGTGRPYTEAVSALDAWGIKKYFDETRIINHNYITGLEEELKSEGKETVLSKPHPFIFLRGAFGSEVSDYDILEGRYDKKKCAKTLVVGDAGADLYAAKAGGFDFAAVLTGIQKEDAREFFEKENATYILDDVLGLSKKS